MADNESYIDQNTHRIESRETADASDVAKATSKSDPRTSGSVLGDAKADPNEPKPPADQNDLSAVAKYNKALKAYRANKAGGSQQAVKDMLAGAAKP